MDNQILGTFVFTLYHFPLLLQQNMMAMDSRMLRQKIWVRDENVVLGMRFWPSISVDIACRKIREKMSDTTRRNCKYL